MAPEQPKKVAGGAFGQYMSENRAALIKENPGKPATASVKLGSERFKALSASAKAKYEKMYEDAKKQYEKDMAAFLAAGGEPAARKSKKDKKEKKAAKDPNKPKKPAGGAYGCYMEKHRAEFTKACAGQPVTAVSKLASERWKALSASQKQPFEKAYAEKKAAYDEAMKHYVPPVPEKDDEDGDEEDEEDEEGGEEDEEEEEASPKKRKANVKADTSPAKKGKTSSDVEAEAKKLGFSGKLKNLCDNPKVKASPAEILAELQKQQGSVVAAKKALAGA